MSRLVALIRQYRNELETSAGQITQHQADVTAPDDPRGPEYHNAFIEAHQADSIHLQRIIGLLSAGLTAEEKAELDPPPPALAPEIAAAPAFTGPAASTEPVVVQPAPKKKRTRGK